MNVKINKKTVCNLQTKNDNISELTIHNYFFKHIRFHEKKMLFFKTSVENVVFSSYNDLKTWIREFIFVEITII